MQHDQQHDFHVWAYVAAQHEDDDYDDDFEDHYLDEEQEEQPWTDEDEAGLEEWEERRRARIAETNEY